MKLKDKSAENVWNKILYGERILSDEEAEEMHKVSKKIRKDWRFRKILQH